jgi:DNA-directed RNA polymerase subunit RPC12/RpoP
MKYVTLATVNDIYEAHFLTSALEEEGIRYIEANETTATLLPHLRQGIEIRVKDTDFLRAKVVSNRVEEMRRLRCPNCDSTSIKYQGEEGRELTPVETILSLVHFPVKKYLLIYQCSTCGTIFKIK